MKKSNNHGRLSTIVFFGCHMGGHSTQSLPPLHPLMNSKLRLQAHHSSGVVNGIQEARQYEHCSIRGMS